MENVQPTPAMRSEAQSGAAAQPPGRHRMELWISHVLRAGVTVSAAVIAVGLVLRLLQGPGPGQAASLHDLQARGDHAIAIDPNLILTGVLHGRGSGIIQLGLLLLILTPITRVAMTMVLFLLQRDHVFTLVTLVVLAILILGLIGVGA